MKKRKLGLIASVVAVGAGILVAPGGSAIERPDYCDAVDSAAKLHTCIEAHVDTTLASNIDLADTIIIDTGPTITLNLAGYNIARTGDGPAFALRHGEFVFDGTGTISADSAEHPAVEISGSSTPGSLVYSVAYIEKDVELKNDNFAALTVTGDDTDKFYGVEVYFDGKATGKYGIQVEKNISTFNIGLPRFYIADGAEIIAETDAETDAPGQAIRAEGRATWYIKKATITGDTGIALRAGKFYLDGPVITATGPEEAYLHWFATDKSGDTWCESEICEKLPGSGAAIQIQEAQTEAEDGINDIEIYINGGTYESKHGYAISEYKEREENPNPTFLIDTANVLKITEGNLMAFTDITDEQKAILKNETRYTLGMVTDDFSWRFGDGRMCADGSASVKSYDEDWLRTHFEVHPFAKINGLDEIYAGLPWVERLLVDYVHFPGPYNQYDFDDAENVALDVYAESKGIKYEDIKFTDLFDIVLYRFEKDNYEFGDGEEGYFRGSLTDPSSGELGAGTSKPYTIITDTEDYPLTFTMKLPEGILAVEDGYVRTYKLLDLHCQSGGTQEESETCEVFELPVELSEDGTEYTFTTTKFSAFVFTYSDEKNEEPEPEPEDEPIVVPDTGDFTAESASANVNSNASVLIITISVITLVASVWTGIKAHRG